MSTENKSIVNPENRSKWHMHPMFSGFIGTLLGVVVTTIFGIINTNAKYNDYIPFDNISILIENYLVASNCVDKDILDLETPIEQFKMIEDTFVELKDTYASNILDLKSENQRLNKLIESLNSNIDELKKNNNALNESNKLLGHRKTVDLKKTNLIISGELMNAGESINNTVAVIDGNNYYSQSFLNTYILDDDSHIKYNETENAVILGNQKPEKTKFNWDGMVTDTDKVIYYRLGDSETFSMGTDVYNEGCRIEANASFYVHLKCKYSKMSFTYGHIDNTERDNLELTIFALDENRETYTTVIKTITLSGEMEPKDIEIPISYASAIKVVVSDGFYKAKYGLSNIYFYS